ncbi:hypothetical protein B0H12DRAFT_439581 [Mycena haematopus]|nr:hypothetical protein B0H12DRAFT_439581 [Mycena haematopus]
MFTNPTALAPSVCFHHHCSHSILAHHAQESPPISANVVYKRNSAQPLVFANCQNTTISGGVILQVNTNDADDSDENDFRRVRWGDINFLKAVTTQNIIEYHDVPHKRTGVAKKRVQRVVGVRRIHQAHIIGFHEDFTAVVYEGSEFEKHRAYAEWREDLRHPSLVQLFGVTSSPRHKALIYHDSW